MEGSDCNACNDRNIHGGLSVVTFNMHGFNQGWPTVLELMNNFEASVILLQEHWQTPANLSKFNELSDSYFCFGSSAMSNVVESGLLRGRPFGGIMCLIKKSLRSSTETIFCSDRFAVVRVLNYLIVNLYLPCVGTENRQIICDDLLAQIANWYDQYSTCDLILAGDFNVDLDSNDYVALAVTQFLATRNVVRCDTLFSSTKTATYVNDALMQYSTIDFIATSTPGVVEDFSVLEWPNNFSDHLPVIAIFNSIVTDEIELDATHRHTAHQLPGLLRFRWDKADISSYYSQTGSYLSPILERLNCDWQSLCYDDRKTLIENVYNDVVDAMVTSANSYIPRCRRNFFKFWWDEELRIFKEASVNSDKLWKEAGRPGSGPIFRDRQSCRLRYRQSIKEHQKAATLSYTNDLHDALLHKDGPRFWKSWRSKFELTFNCEQVDGCVDPSTIAGKFQQHFSGLCSSVDDSHAQALEDEFENRWRSYAGAPLLNNDTFDVELVSLMIARCEHGKAAGLDNITAEHLHYSHPVLPCVLMKLFNLMFDTCYVPRLFGQSYIVPIPKHRNCNSKSLTVDDFRGIAISPLLSKLYEMCIYDRFQEFLISSDNQFGFKKGIGCSHAIFTLRSVVDRFLNGGCTVNLCAIDLSKAFDKVDHHALFIKLMKREIPYKLLNTLIFWLNNAWTCVRWNSIFSQFFKLNFGVRQGSVLSPYLFAVYIDDIIKSFSFDERIFIIIYADDIILIAPSLTKLQSLFTLCELELKWLGMSINANKSCCMRIGQRCQVPCGPITSIDGDNLPWVTEIKYLGIYIVQAKVFKCSIKEHKRSFFRSANSIFGKIGRIATEDVTLQLIVSKCLPVLLYGLECFKLNVADTNSLDYTFNHLLIKLFKTTNIDIINSCRLHFGLKLPSELLVIRQQRFLRNYNNTDNYLCHMFSFVR